MKEKTVLKSLDDLSHEVLEPEADRSAPDYLEWIPESLEEPRHVALPVPEPEHYYSAGYPHWGLNE
jgi:hypothetical protein